MTTPALSLVQNPAFIKCVMWAITQPLAREQFKAATGIDLSDLDRRDAITAFLDLGQRDGAAIARFADWVAENVWEEPRP